jgi:hypothetical protein
LIKLDRRNMSRVIVVQIVVRATGTAVRWELGVCAIRSQIYQREPEVKEGGIYTLTGDRLLVF